MGSSGAQCARNSVSIKFSGASCSGKTVLATFVAGQLRKLGLECDHDYGDAPDFSDVITVRTGGRNLQKVYAPDAMRH